MLTLGRVGTLSRRRRANTRYCGPFREWGDLARRAAPAIATSTHTPSILTPGNWA